MTPKQQQALQGHIEAIANILYEETSPEQVKNTTWKVRAIARKNQLFDKTWKVKGKM